MIWRLESASADKKQLGGSNHLFDGSFKNRDFWGPGGYEKLPPGPWGLIKITPRAPKPYKT